MSKKIKEIVETKSEDGKPLTLGVKHPSSRQYQEADVVYSAEWTRLVEEPDERKRVKTKKQNDEMLEARGIWTKVDEEKKERIHNEIIELGKQLKAGKTAEGKRMTKSDGRRLAIAMHEKRNELREHLAIRAAYDTHSAEAKAENVKFDYLVSVCTVDNKTGDPYFADLDDYDKRRDEKASWAAARKLAEMIYGGDFSENFEDNVMEIQFLKKFDFIDKDGNYIDPKTKARVDVDGNPLPKDKQDVDVYGNVIKDGKVEVEFGEFLDDEIAPQSEKPKSDDISSPLKSEDVPVPV